LKIKYCHSKGWAETEENVPLRTTARENNSYHGDSSYCLLLYHL